MLGITNGPVASYLLSLFAQTSTVRTERAPTFPQPVFRCKSAPPLPAVPSIESRAARPPTSPTSCVTCRGHMRCKQKCPRKAVLASSSQSLPSSPAHAHLSMPRLCQTRRHPNQPNRPHAPLQDALGVQTSQICCKSGALPLTPALPRPFARLLGRRFPFARSGMRSERS